MVNEAKEKQRRYHRERYARKQVEKVDRRKALGHFMGLTGDAMKAQRDFDKANSELASMGFFMGLFLLASASMVGAQGYWVIEDTNQLQTLAHLKIKVTYRTDLYQGQIITHVSTNWLNKGTPEKSVLPNGTLALVVQQEGRLTTNVDHEITFANETRTWNSSQTFGPPIATNNLIIAAPPEAPLLAVPTRQQR